MGGTECHVRTVLLLLQHRFLWYTGALFDLASGCGWICVMSLSRSEEYHDQWADLADSETCNIRRIHDKTNASSCGQCCPVLGHANKSCS